MSETLLLELQEVSKIFNVDPNPLKRSLGIGQKLCAVDQFSLRVTKGNIIGLVGESGCGKSTTALLIVKLLNVSKGTILYRGQNITEATGTKMRPFRERVQMVFQDSSSALNPRKTVKRTLLEALRRRFGRTPDLEGKAIELLAVTGLGPEILPRYPHALSGGQRQRVGIARALAMEPEFIILDEPVSALDVSLQAQVIKILKGLSQERDLTMMFISHDLALVNHLCNQIVVMYAGRVVETGSPDEVMRQTAHPYTKALIAAVPRGLRGRREPLPVLVGNVERSGEGCNFAPRCPKALPICREIVPREISLTGQHKVACHLLDEGKGP
ncbi:MAG: ABC transporter ATP-binding protein [Deltaproteobacteria bacterium]|jgi:oligopeptide/dipeptide ABC transporter ATP-binding protein|nr:ABC transporter ATP-binding protein [Deltaproteobacteria bacterium]MBT4640856.1 ABC transporter ATP-binding protein [Deltaproteobacteria bacterium]MBT6502377.1 ABC transporter ATP-binding protein [Deltaproteobacteria bacterium]MBT7155876.1 ABC transporter ATP-binding protein [Deltaproteobacteria bacterium]MBT7711666.1 ABC transporter ATP-binding protein [Deltaproteobacteria bacterium]